jgi:GNAT superfamily N-acetyltransferase
MKYHQAIKIGVESMVTFKRLSDCTFNEAVTAWNRGFEGYFFNMTTTVDRFTARLVMEDLSPDLSLIAFDGNEPIGIVLNGIRNINGRKMAWNGGTGVASAYRGKGIGKALIEESLSIYKSNDVHIATLEAISENEKAISLYKSLGYSISDQLVYLQHSGFLQQNIFQTNENYHLEKVSPQEVSILGFYRHTVPWQTQWQSTKGGEALIAIDKKGRKVGYALYRRMYNEQGDLLGESLLHCAADPNYEGNDSVIKYLLKHVFSKGCQHYVVNLPVSDLFTYSLLKKAGFTVKVEQCYMMKLLEK